MEKAKLDQETKDKLTVSDWMYGLFGFVLIFGLPSYCLWGIAPDWAKYSAVYAVKYHANFSDVHVEKQPNDCDWMHAPIGDKDCHYSQHAYPLRNDSGHVMSVQVGWDKIQD